MPHGSFIRPMLRPLCTLSDLLPQRLFFFFSKRLIGLMRRHDFRFVVRRDPPDQFTSRRITRADDGSPVAKLLDCLFIIKSQFRFARCFVRSVASKTLVRQDQAYVPVKVDLPIGSFDCPADRCGQANRDETIHSLVHNPTFARIPKMNPRHRCGIRILRRRNSGICLLVGCIISHRL